MKKKLLSLLLLGGLTLTAGAQQLPNGDFNGDWVDCSPYTTGTTKKVGTQPKGWCISNTVSNYMMTTGVEIGTKETNGDNFSVKLTNKNMTVFTINQNVPAYISLGTTWSTAKVSLGSGVSNEDGGVFGGLEFSNKPDALKLKYKRSHGNSNPNENATVLAYLWKGTWTQVAVPANINKSTTTTTMIDRERCILKDVYSLSTNQGGEVSSTPEAQCVASLLYKIEGDANNWKELVIPFVYRSNNTPEKINIVLAANDYFEDKSNIGADNSLSVDDVALVYYSTLKTLSYNGVAQTIPEVGETLDMSSVEYDAAKLSYTLNGQTATAQYSYDEATCKLTITVSNVDADVDGQSSHTYYVQFATPQSEPDPEPQPEIVSSTDYSDNLVVVINGENTLPQETTINVSKMSDGSYTLSLNDFMLVAGEEMLPVGNIVLEGLTATEENETISFSTNQSILIQPGSTGSAGGWYGPMLGEVPIEMTAKVSGGKMKCEIDIDMTGSLGQVINVYFGVVNNLETEALPDAEGVHVVLNRTFQPGWSTLYLQYDVTKEELGAVKVMALHDYDAESQALVFREVVSDDIGGNYPYLVKFESEKANPFFANRLVWNSGDSHTSGPWLFTGTFTGIAAPGMEGKYGVTADADGYQYIRRGGKNASIKGTRAFFVYYGEDQGVQQMRIRIEGEDGVTSIDGVETVIGSFDIYNLQGIRVRTAATSLEGLTPGVYVVNGKKVMVK